MRTTIDISDQLLRSAKAVAAMEGKSLKAFLTEAIKHELQRSAQKKISRRRIELPLIPSKHPGTLDITGDSIAAAINQEDIHAFAGR